MEIFLQKNSILFDICVEVNPNSFAPSQIKELREGIVSRHHGIIQFKMGEKIYATADNEIVRRYLESKNFEVAEYGEGGPVVDYASPGVIEQTFDELHGKLYGANPSAEWGIPNPEVDEMLMRKYRKYVALFCDQKLHDQNLTSSSEMSPSEDLRELIRALKESDPYFMESLDDFERSPVGESFKMMLRNKKLKGKECVAKRQIEERLAESNDPDELLAEWVNKYLDEKHRTLLSERMTSCDGLDRESVSYFKKLLIEERSETYLKEQEQAE